VRFLHTKLKLRYQSSCESQGSRHKGTLHSA